VAESRGELEALLAEHGQAHLLQFWNELTVDQRRELARDIGSVDFALLKRLYQRFRNDTGRERCGALEPPPAIRLSEECESARMRAVELGRQAIADGKVAMILVAGGQGTRLGFDRPKGLFPIGPLSRRTLFQVLVDRLRAIRRRHDAAVPLWILTSPATDEATRAYFRERDYLGLPPADVHFFCQGTMPAVDRANGRVLLADRHRIALSPNGHGGMLAALDECGGLEQAAERGIEYFFYGQVDNPLLPVCDPRMIGHHIEYASELTSLAVVKRHADERVGNFVQTDACVQIIEYIDFPEEAARRVDASGRLVFWAGSIAVHVMNRAFLQRAAARADALPFHFALKKTPFVNEQGERIEPDQPNSVKFERFIFDLLPLAERPLVVEVERDEAFAPVKNADGSPADTPAAARRMMIAQHRRWLEAAGARVADVPVEIHPLWADSAEEVAGRLGCETVVDEPTYFTDC